MKNYIKIFTIISISLLLVNCDSTSYLGGADPYSGWIEFNSDTQVISGGDCPSTTPITLPVTSYAILNDKDDVIVSYTINDLVGNSSDFLSADSGTFIIPKGSLTGELVLPVINGAILTSGTSFEVTLTDTNRSNLSVGLPDGSKIKTITLTAGKYLKAGTYSTLSNGDASPVWAAFGLPGSPIVTDLAYEVTITETAVTGVFEVSDSTSGVYIHFYSPYGGGTADRSMEITSDPITGVVSGSGNGLFGGAVTFTGTLDCGNIITGNWTGSTAGSSDSGSVVMTLQ